MYKFMSIEIFSDEDDFLLLLLLLLPFLLLLPYFSPFIFVHGFSIRRYY